MAYTIGPISKEMVIGLSTDVKPIDGIDFSTQFYEYDTGKTYIWTGTAVMAPNMGQWVEYLPLYPADFYNLVNHPEN